MKKKKVTKKVAKAKPVKKKIVKKKPVKVKATKKTSKVKKSVAKKKAAKAKPVKKKIVKKKPVKAKTQKKISKKAKKKVTPKKVAKKKVKKPISKKKAKKTKPLKFKRKKKLKHKLKKISKKTKRVLRKVKVIKKLPRAGTGIRGFDKMVQGGFERNSINLMVGGSGSGKSIMALQFILDGVKKGETGLYITFEEKKEEFYTNMKKFGWDLEKLEKTGKFFFLEYSPEKVKMMLDEGGGTIESMVFRYKIKRMVIDSITSFSLLFEDVLSKRQANLGLFDIINKWDCTTLLPVQHDPTKEPGEEISTIEFEADSITLLYFIKVQGKRKRFIEILKMRGTNHSKDTRSFALTRKGVIIGKTSSIKKYLR